MLLALAAAIGVPVSALAYFFLYFVSYLQKLIFVQLPVDLGFKGEPVWWPLPILMVSGLLVASCIKYLPGTSGHSPADGFQFGGGAPSAVELPGVVLAALATLALGVVLGPEAPLIAIGGGLGVIAVRLAKRDAPPATAVVMAAAGSFAAISTLFGSPILGAFLLMEASGLGGPLDGPHPGPGPPFGRHRIPHLRRPERLDRSRRVLARHPEPADVFDARCSRIRMGRCHRPRRRQSWAWPFTGWPCFFGRGSPGAC